MISFLAPDYRSVMRDLGKSLNINENVRLSRYVYEEGFGSIMSRILGCAAVKVSLSLLFVELLVNQ